MDNVLSFAFPAGGASEHIQGHERGDIGSEDKVTPGDDLPAMNGFFVILRAMFTGFWI